MKQNQRACLLAAIGLAGAGVLLPVSAARAADVSFGRPPNFVLIFTDDQGYQDIGCFGSPLIKTPHLDQMAKEGRRFTSFYSASSVCSPSRAGLLTGCYPVRVSVPRVLFPGSKTGLSPDEITMKEVTMRAVKT